MHTAHDLSATVRAEIARAGRTPTSTAKACGISYSRWRRRMAVPGRWTVAELHAIAAELGIDPAILTGAR